MECKQIDKGYFDEVDGPSLRADIEREMAFKGETSVGETCDRLKTGEVDTMV